MKFFPKHNDIPFKFLGYIGLFWKKLNHLREGRNVENAIKSRLWDINSKLNSLPKTNIPFDIIFVSIEELFKSCALEGFFFKDKL